MEKLILKFELDRKQMISANDRMHFQQKAKITRFLRQLAHYEGENTLRDYFGLPFNEKKPCKVIQLEGLLSRELFSEIAKYVFNHYEWPESLDDEVDRITLAYRTKGELGRNKVTVRKALYTAYMLGV